MFDFLGVTYMVVASNSKRDSPVFSWKKDHFQPLQFIETSYAFDVEEIEIGNRLYLVVASFKAGTSSPVFKWHNGRFVQDHHISESGADVESFSINGHAYLVITGKM